MSGYSDANLSGRGRSKAEEERLREDDDGNVVVRTFAGKGNKNLQNVRQFDPESGGFGAITPSGTFEVGQLIRLIGGNFESGALPTVTWSTNEVNGGTVSVITGELTLETNTTANGQAEVQTVNRAEFVTATFNKAHLAFAFPSPTNADCIREFGLFDPINNLFSGDGVFFRVDNGGDFSVVRRKAGTDEEVVKMADFNGETFTDRDPTFTLDSNIAIYEILYNAGRIDFLRNRLLLHRMTSLDAVAYETVHLTLGARVENINGNTTDNMLLTRGFSCSRVGSTSSEPDSVTVNAAGSAVLKNSPGQLLEVLITDTGVGGASLELFDNTVAVGTPIATVDLTTSLISLPFNRRLNNGLAYTATGAGFELEINWR